MEYATVYRHKDLIIIDNVAMCTVPMNSEREGGAILNGAGGGWYVGCAHGHAGGAQKDCVRIQLGNCPVGAGYCLGRLF